MADPIVCHMSDWCIVSMFSTDQRLMGHVADHPRKAVGTLITSNITGAVGRRVTTASGTVYELVGEPAYQQHAFLKQHGLKYDPENPVPGFPPARSETEAAELASGWVVAGG